MWYSVVGWAGLRGLMIQEPLQLRDGAELQQHTIKTCKKRKKNGGWGVSRGDSKPRGGRPDCCQHWLYPPPKATGMLSAQCSICTENKGPVTGGDKNRTELSHFRCHSPGKHHGPHLEHIVRIKAGVNKQATKRDLDCSPMSTNDFYRRRPGSSPGVPQKV